MEENTKKTILKYALASFFAAGVTLIMVTLRDFGAMTEAEKFRELANCFTVPGVLLIMIFIMTYISTTGFFDILTYSLVRLGRALVPLSKKVDERYADYKERKNEVRFSGYSFLLHVGLVFTLVSIVFTVLFYTV